MTHGGVRTWSASERVRGWWGRWRRWRWREVGGGGGGVEGEEEEERRQSGGGGEAVGMRWGCGLGGRGARAEERRRGEEERRGGEERWREGAADLRPLVKRRGNGAREVARHALLEPLVEHLVLRLLERLRTRAPRQRRSGAAPLCGRRPTMARGVHGRALTRTRSGSSRYCSESSMNASMTASYVASSGKPSSR